MVHGCHCDEMQHKKTRDAWLCEQCTPMLRFGALTSIHYIQLAGQHAKWKYAKIAFDRKCARNSCRLRLPTGHCRGVHQKGIQQPCGHACAVFDTACLTSSRPTMAPFSSHICQAQLHNAPLPAARATSRCWTASIASFWLHAAALGMAAPLDRPPGLDRPSFSKLSRNSCARLLACNCSNEHVHGVGWKRRQEAQTTLHKCNHCAMSYMQQH